MTPAAEIDRLGRAWRCVKAGELADAAAVQQVIPLRGLEIETVRRYRLVVGAAAHAALGAGLLPRLVIIGDQLVARLEGFAELVVGRDDRVGAIVEQRLEMVVEQRQPVFHADMALPRRYRLVEQILARDIAEQLAIAAAEALDALRRQQHFADGQQHDLVALAGRELRHRVERADRLDRVAEPVEPHRLRRARRKEIDQSAADRELARLHHRVGAAIAVGAEIGRELRDLERLALAQDGSGIGVEAARRHLLECSPCRSEHDARRRSRLPGRREPRQGLQPLRHDVGMRRQPVVGQAIPGREDHDLPLGREEAQPVL